MYIVALTGGIGSGKSEAARQFANLGVPVVDTDVIAHELTTAGSPLLLEIRQIFGSEVFNDDGSLNRGKLRALVLDCPAQRLRLEALLHPAIHERAIEQLEKNDRAIAPQYQILVIPLLFESTRYDDIINRIVVVDCDENTQIRRAMARSNLSRHEVESIMAAQTSRNVRLSGAHEVLENNDSLEELNEKVNKLHNKLIKTCIVSK